MSETYDEFLRKKEFVPKDAGFEPVDLNDRLYPFQRDIVTWACRRGKAAVFADCGMGKTPMQLDVIERAVKLWSAPGDLVLSPFAGIGSEGYVAVRNGRKFVGIELKPSYYCIACKNLDEAVREASQRTLFDFADAAAV